MFFVPQTFSISIIVNVEDEHFADVVFDFLMWTMFLVFTLVVLLGADASRREVRLIAAHMHPVRALQFFSFCLIKNQRCNVPDP